MTSDNTSAGQSSNRKVVVWALGIVVGMFGFGFALVPLYEVFCQVTGLNGKTGGRYEVSTTVQVDESRQIRVQFLTNTNENMPWQFKPLVREIKVHPGEQMKVEFYAKNTTGEMMVAQAVPSISPSEGAEFFHKTECFCFNQQILQPGEDINMPLIFLVDKDLPEGLHTLTLSYTLFDVTERTTKTKS
ncbi:cytochrome c oxidase assembly protein [Hahella sp. CCB-MM4]|uniref:cytochrome c oxidase assembly protein n=1 Tax=Hahella sp. (strain CCB-MM4) TaxID=1926491 RepID=UPI000B9A6C24|nr:cytochrome c oxidase assembly protein [Hahella sp. CCB-MM4]OZG73273.1 cytochrome c oxidase assembly protein [Hahella sp. CCB-MM4]